MSNDIDLSGRVTDVFAHRFIVETAAGLRMLADLGPKGTSLFDLKVGIDIVAEGSAKPSELKIHRIARLGGDFVEMEHAEKHRDSHDEDANPGDAVQAVEKAGFFPVGVPRRKPKHFEVLARRGESFVECHVAFDGTVRKEKPVVSGDLKWCDELRLAA